MWNYSALGSTLATDVLPLDPDLAIRVCDKIEKETEALYADSAKLISLLEHVVERTAYDPKETAGVYEFYAKFFWEAVTGERIEGHPRRRIAEQSHG